MGVQGWAGGADWVLKGYRVGGVLEVPVWSPRAFLKIAHRTKAELPRAPGARMWGGGLEARDRRAGGTVIFADSRDKGGRSLLKAEASSRPLFSLTAPPPQGPREFLGPSTGCLGCDPCSNPPCL